MSARFQQKSIFVLIFLAFGSFFLIYLQLAPNSTLFLTVPQWISPNWSWNQTQQQPRTEIPDLDHPHWKKVYHPLHNLSVFRAYGFFTASHLPQPTPPSSITILASHLPFPFPIWPSITCHFHYNWSSAAPSTIPGTLQPIRWIYPQFPGTLINCPLPAQERMPPHVSLYLDNHSLNSTMLPIHYQTVPSRNLPESQKQYPFQFSLCVIQPVYDFNNVSQFLEWLSFYQLMGVQQFTLYNLSIGAQLSCVLHHLQTTRSENLTLTVYPWATFPLHKVLPPPNAFFGHGLSENTLDCILRHKGLTKYLVMVDVDEFIMPREGTSLQNYTSLFHALNDVNSSVKFGEYNFRNAYYNRQDPGDLHVAEKCTALSGYPNFVCRHLLMTRLTRRHSLDKYHSRTKYICRPEAMKVPLIHWVGALEKGYESLDVPVGMAFMRHYRRQVDPEYFPEKDKPRPEGVSEEFGVRLARSVAKKAMYLKHKCNLDERQMFLQ